LIHILGIDVGRSKRNECIIDNKLGSFPFKQDIRTPNNSIHDIQNLAKKEVSTEFTDNNFILGDSFKDAEHCYPNDLPSEKLGPNFRNQSDGTLSEDSKNTQEAEQLEERTLHLRNVNSIPNTNNKGHDDHDSSRLQEYTNTFEDFALSSNENQYLDGNRTSLNNLGKDNTPDIIMDTKEKEHFKKHENITKSGYYNYEVSESASETKISPEMSSLPSATSSAAEFITISEWNEEEEQGKPLQHLTKSSTLVSRNKVDVWEETATTITRTKQEGTEKLDGDVFTKDKENKILSQEIEEQVNDQSDKNVNCSEKSAPPEYSTASTSSQGKYNITDYAIRISE
jgi:hypothetical protein